MTVSLLTNLLFATGLVQFSILTASSLVPFRLNFREDLASLPKLHRQLYWTYGGYVVMSIIAFGCIGVTCAAELAGRSPLARAFCGYVAVFWLVRLALQGVFDVKPHLTVWWLRLGYRVLTVLFAFLGVTYAWARRRAGAMSGAAGGQPRRHTKASGAVDGDHPVAGL